MKISLDSRSNALVIALLASFITPFVASSINIALPVIGRDLGINVLILGWLPTIYLLSLAIFLIPVSRLADIYGRKKIFTWGIVIYTISSFCAGFSVNGEMLLLFRVIQGIGSAMIFGNLTAIVAAAFPILERGKALGVALTGAYLGLFLGPSLGGFLTQNLGWQSIFFFNVPLGIFCAYSASNIKKEWKHAQGQQFDLYGALILASSLVFFMVGLSLLPEIQAIILLFLGIVCGVLFYYFQAGNESPLFEVGLLKNRGFSWNSMAALIAYTAAYPLIFLLSLYLQYALALSPQNAGIILSAQPMVIAALSPFTGRLSDQKNPNLVAAGGMGFIILSLILLLVVSRIGSIYLILGGMVLLGLGFALFSTPNMNMVMSSVQEEFLGAAAATMSSVRVIGQMLGMAISLFFINLYIGTADIKADNLPLFLEAMQFSFIIFAILCLVGLILILQGRKID